MKLTVSLLAVVLACIPSIAGSHPVEQVDNISDLLNITGQTDGDAYFVAGYFTSFPQSTLTGGGMFIWQENLDKNLANGGTIFDPSNTGGFDGTISTLSGFLSAQGTGDGTGCWVRTQVPANVIAASMFGAVDDNTVDSSAPLQAALKHIESYGGELIIDGWYGTLSQLDILVTSQWSIRGLRDKKTSGLKALSAIDYILSISASDGSFQGDIAVRGIRLDCNSLSGGINSGYLRYSTFEEIKINGIPSGGIGLNIGGWVQRVLNNNISGTGYGTGTGLRFSYPTGSSGVQNFVIENNNFVDLEVGIQGSALISQNGTKIVRNTFENCTRAGLWFDLLARGLSIKDNYFETCGGAALDVTGGGDYRYGVIVFSSTSTGFRGVDISGNLFSKVLTHGTPPHKSIIALENPIDFTAKDNALRGGPYDGFVSLDGIGVHPVWVVNARFDLNDTDDVVDRAVLDNVNTPDRYGNFKAKHITYNRNPHGQWRTNHHGQWRTQSVDLFQDVTSWTKIGSADFAKGFETGAAKYTYTTAASGAAAVITISEPAILDFLKGKYMRVIGRVKPGSPATNGLRVDYWLKTKTTGVLDLVFSSSRSGTRNVRVTDGQVIYVPFDATEIQILVDTIYDVGGVSDMEIYNLELVDTADL